MSILPRKAWTLRQKIFWLIVACLALLLWSYETDRLLISDPAGVVGCAEYKENINSLHNLFPAALPAEERCARTPDKCGPTGLIANPSGMQTYYYRSQCYADLAESAGDETWCDQVVERPSLLFNGAYYSRTACLRRVQQRLADQSAPKVGPEQIARIASLTAAFAADGDLAIALTLSPDVPVPGSYALSTLAKIPDTVVALNPEHPAISYDDSYARLLPVGHWILSLSPERGGATPLNIAVQTGQLSETLKRAGAREFDLEVRLQFLQDTDGALSDPARPRAAYISEQSVRVPF